VLHLYDIILRQNVQLIRKDYTREHYSGDTITSMSLEGVFDKNDNMVSDGVLYTKYVSSLETDYQHYNYPTGFYENKEDKEENEEYKREKIDNYVKYFAVNNISMICFKILNITDKMFKCFETIYKKENKSELFSIERNNLDKLIINKATEIYDKKQVELINKLKEKYLNN
jgi:hypothetical protein